MRKKALLSMLPVGDWRKRDIVEVYMSPLIERISIADKDRAASAVASSLAQGLAWHKLVIYPRHRWLGCEAAISQPTILEACHGLLRPAYQQFCAMVGKKAPWLV